MRLLSDEYVEKRPFYLPAKSPNFVIFVSQQTGEGSIRS
jgi:hypothetical protein